ncbi:mercury resistance system transport protein MerF [Halothiobacillus sp.]|uniref:mercury resistance system transport protein MerF n=1 Tax=Halothiobacillus sp. TaxID=1891311 RepID=UPI0026227694|nr:mercury resistance system transport protein MerF [Halothiobacillus sp.]
MKTSTLLKTGTVGVIISALCCFTPVLVFVFGAVGLAAWIGYIDYVLMPALLFFVGLIIYAVNRKSKTQCGINANCQTSKGDRS